MSHLFALVMITAVMASAIAGLRRDHAREIYAIWYLFSLALSIFFVLNLLAAGSGVALTDVLGPAWARSMSRIYDALTNLRDELWLVGGFVFLAIVPQIVAYILSGPSGSSSPPILVRHVSTAAFLSVVKFLALWSGIVAARPIAMLALGGPVPPHDFQQPFVTLALSFVLANAERHYLDELRYVTIFPGLRATVRAPSAENMLYRLHVWFTRHAKPETRSWPSIALFGTSTEGSIKASTAARPAPQVREAGLDDCEIGVRAVYLGFRGPIAKRGRDFLPEFLMRREVEP